MSAYYYYDNNERIFASGIDHVSAKFTGTSLKVFPGPNNNGIFINIPEFDEEYQLTHPTAQVNGFLKASLYLTITGKCVISCPKSGYCAVLEYKDEPFFGKCKFLVSGTIRNEKNEIICTLEGSWKGKISYKKTNGTPKDLVDLSDLVPFQKYISHEQSENESRMVWKGVISAYNKREYKEATALKRAIEDKQRRIAKERKSAGKVYENYWFEQKLKDGKPQFRTNMRSNLPFR
jgi:hypothetical protein